MEQALENKELILLVSVGVLIMLLLALAFVLLAGMSQRKILEQQMKVQKVEIEHREQLLHSTILTQEAERKRIAKDLHDDLGSKLNVIKLNMYQVQKLGDPSPDFKEKITTVKDLIDKTIGTTRRISHELLPPTLEDFGLSTALEELCDGFNASENIQIELKTDYSEERLPKVEDELQLFRVVQELVNNSIRHGKATTIDIELIWEEKTLKLNYEDNGGGFDVSQLEKKKGLGLKNIDSRLNMISGQIKYESSPGNGVHAFIELNT